MYSKVFDTFDYFNFALLVRYIHTVVIELFLDLGETIKAKDFAGLRVSLLADIQLAILYSSRFKCCSGSKIENELAITHVSSAKSLGVLFTEFSKSFM